MAKQEGGWLQRNVRRVTHAEDQTEAQRARAPWIVVAFLLALVLVALGVWGYRVFVFEPSQAEPAPSSSAPADETQPSGEGLPPVESAEAACTLENNDQDVSSVPPVATRWVVEGFKIVPEVPGAGPCIEHEGFRTGFAQTQTGAIVATYYYGSTLVPSNPGAATKAQAEYALADGPMKASILQHITDVENGVEVRSSTDELVGQEFAGYRLVSYTPESAVVELLIRRTQDGAIVGGIAKLVWIDGDWRIDPAAPTEWASPNLNARLADYVLWDSRSVGA
ncbi:hypothetical protein [Pseudoclavibacter helvolus]|uniref:hypothetical protein n=1 Tax=Pseudoclavibacter helvolus TaxID=255205 RepID=UPI0024AD4628|nr:hypothetical protein [Pseudoclavibacter helvolus]